MATRTYRLTVIACALAWFLVGLHVPALHQMSHDGHVPGGSVLAATALLVAAAIAGLWALLRAPAGGRSS